MCKNNNFYKNYYLLKVKHLNNYKARKKNSSPPLQGFRIQERGSLNER